MRYRYYNPNPIKSNGAKSYLVAPNSTATLWDSERQTIYLKSADASGMPSMKILDYTIRDDGANSGNIPPVMNEPNNNTEYVLIMQMFNQK